MLGLAPDVADHRPRARHPAAQRARGCAPPRAVGAVPPRRLDRGGGRRPRRRHRSPAHRRRGRGRDPPRSRQRAAGAGRRPRGRGTNAWCRSRTPSTTSRRPAPRSRGATSLRPAAALSGRRRRARPSSGRPSTPPGWCPAWSACPRPVRAAPSSARCGGSTASATASSTSTPPSSPAARVEPGDPVEVHLGTGIRAARWVHTYADAKPSELVLLVDSYGLLSLALDRESAADGSRPARRERRHPAARRRHPERNGNAP